MLTSNLEKATTRELLTLYARVLEHLRERDVRSSNNPLAASWSPQNRPTVVRAKPANGSGRGLGCSTLQPRVEASPFLYASSEDHI
jgi:hypothetical protein